MTEITSNLPKSNTTVAAAPPRRDQKISVRRISFVAQAPPGSLVHLAFKQPRSMIAVEVPADLAEIPGGPTHSLDVVISSAQDVGPLHQPEAEPPILIALKSGATIEWRPGRAIIRGAGDDAEGLLTSLITFGFLEGELRTLEKLVESHEPQALEDIPRAHRISHRNRKHWARIGETIESLTLARLTLARLEPALANVSGNLPPVGRQLARKLLAKAQISTRLAALSGRLEALEDLYEGANDRIADYRGWHKGHLMEIIIVILLIAEIVLMVGDLYLRHLEISQ